MYVMYFSFQPSKFSNMVGAGRSSPSSASTAATSMTISKTEGIHSAVPLKATHPRLTRKISASDPAGSGIFGRRLHAVLYYRSAARGDSGWAVAGWIRESLGRALSEQPILAGRLRRAQDGEAEFEIVSNDGGVRIVEAAWSSMTLSQFLELEDREDLEADQLVTWKDIDEENPHFCPLFYVQVTNFECGAYAVGISCSLLLADPLGMASFIKRWTNIHNTLLSENNMSKLPLFYLMNLRRLGDTPSPRAAVSSNATRNQRPGAKIFAIAEDMNPNDRIFYRAAASACVEEAERRLGTKLAGKYWLLVKGPSEDTKMEACSKEAIEIVPLSVSIGEITELRWDELWVGEVAFFEGNRPIHVSFWITGSAINDHHGFVMISPSSSHEGCSGINVIVVSAEEKI